MKPNYKESNEDYLQNKAWEKGQRWIKTTDRWDKMEFLKMSCSSDFLDYHLMDEMVRWMGEDDFNEFFKHLCKNWEIQTPPELDYAMSH